MLSTVQFVTDASPTLLGEFVEIRLINLNNLAVLGVSRPEVDFDDVRLDASPLSTNTASGPATGLMLVISLTAMTVGRRRRRR